MAQVYGCPGSNALARTPGPLRTKRWLFLALLPVLLALPATGEEEPWVPLALSTRAEKLYVTWNAGRSGKVGARYWDCCALSVIRIPESERML